jgi:hypothetical protein
MGQSFAVPDDIDEADLMAELEGLEADLALEEPASEGAVPSYLQVRLKGALGGVPWGLACQGAQCPATCRCAWLEQEVAIRQTTPALTGQGGALWSARALQETELPELPSAPQGQHEDEQLPALRT